MYNSPKPFVIITMVRCGSYFLSSLLNSADDVRCFGELYKKNAVEMPRDDLRRLNMTRRDVDLRNRLGYHFLDRVVDLNPEKCTGFKAFPDHFWRAGMMDLNASPHWRKILLTRNVIEQYVSLIRARATGIYTYFQGDTVEPELLDYAVEIDFDDFERFLSYRKDVDLEFDRMQSCLEPDLITRVDYESLMRPDTIRHLLDFIGSNAHPSELHSNRRKQFVHPLHKGVRNFTELQAYLASTNRLHLLPARYKEAADQICAA